MSGFITSRPCSKCGQRPAEQTHLCPPPAPVGPAPVEEPEEETPDA